MNKLFLMILLLTVSTSLLASNYPPDYCKQTARFANNGPAVFGSVSSGCMSNTYVLGYKNSGMFGERDFIEAVITVKARSSYDGSSKSETVVIKMEREWNGTGFMSVPFDLPKVYYGSSSIISIKIAFSSEDEWDSNYGSDYSFSPKNFNLVKRANYQNSTGDIVLSIWDFIVSLMDE